MIKKLLTIFSILLLIFTVSACKKQEQVFDNREEKEIIKDEKESLTENLTGKQKVDNIDEENFFRKEGKKKGELISYKRYEREGNRKMSLLGYNSNLLKEKYSDVDYKDWNTYKDEEYGFEFRYPQNWKIEKTDPVGFFIRSHQGDSLIIKCDIPEGEIKKSKNWTTMFISRFKLDQSNSLKEWFWEKIGKNTAGNLIERIWTNNIYYVIEDNIDNSGYITGYIDHTFLFSSDNASKKFFHLSFRERDEGMNYGFNYNRYLIDFEKLINSVRATN